MRGHRHRTPDIAPRTPKGHSRTAGTGRASPPVAHDKASRCQHEPDGRYCAGRDGRGAVRDVEAPPVHLRRLSTLRPGAGLHEADAPVVVHERVPRPPGEAQREPCLVVDRRVDEENGLRPPLDRRTAGDAESVAARPRECGERLDRGVVRPRAPHPPAGPVVPDVAADGPAFIPEQEHARARDRRHGGRESEQCSSHARGMLPRLRCQRPIVERPSSACREGIMRLRSSFRAA